MGKTNTQTVALAAKYLGWSGATFQRYCGLGLNDFWCDAFMTYVFHKSKNAKLFCDGRKQVYCPDTYTWCLDELALLPLYMVLPGDIIFFDWQPNGVPDHIGMVVSRKSDTEVYTIEGNTGGSVVANRTRKESEVLGVFRPHYAAVYNPSKLLTIDGYFGYNSIAMLQKALGVSVTGVFDQKTVRHLQKKAGLARDGYWGVKTSKAVQKMLKDADLYSGEVDGWFGPKSVKALQKWINRQLEPRLKIADAAKDFAYSGFPSKAKYPSGVPKAAYKSALVKAYPDRSSWGKAARAGASCDVFVGTCVRAKGVDPDFPRGLKEQIPYLIKSKKFTEINYSKSKLQPGDIVIYKRKNAGTHILIVKNTKLHLCEANHESTYGITRTSSAAINYRLKTSNKEWIRCYRAK